VLRVTYGPNLYKASEIVEDHVGGDPKVHLPEGLVLAITLGWIPSNRKSQRRPARAWREHRRADGRDGSRARSATRLVTRAAPLNAVAVIAAAE